MVKIYSVAQSSANHQEVAAVVGMAVYKKDRVEWVEQAVDSVVNQSYKSFRFIIIIDGEVSEELRELLFSKGSRYSFITILSHEKNKGLSASMNHVIDYSRKFNPKFFFRMDADDISHPERLAKQIDFFKYNKDISILGTGLVEVDESGKLVGKRSLPIHHDEIVRFLPKRCSLNHPTVAMRFEIFENGFRYNDNLKNTQDYFFWVELVAHSYKFANLKEKLLQFRRVNDFYKRRGLSKSINEFKARFYAMKVLHRYSLGNVLYACSVLLLRLMPSKIVKLAYKIDRYLLNKRVRHE